MTYAVTSQFINPILASLIPLVLLVAGFYMSREYPPFRVCALAAVVAVLFFDALLAGLPVIPPSGEELFPRSAAGVSAFFDVVVLLALFIVHIKLGSDSDYKATLPLVFGAFVTVAGLCVVDLVSVYLAHVNAAAKAFLMFGYMLLILAPLVLILSPYKALSFCSLCLGLVLLLLFGADFSQWVFFGVQLSSFQILAFGAFLCGGGWYLLYLGKSIEMDEPYSNLPLLLVAAIIMLFLSATPVMGFAALGG